MPTRRNKNHDDASGSGPGRRASKRALASSRQKGAGAVKRPARVTPIHAQPPRNTVNKEANMPKVTPLRDRVLVKRLEEVEQKVGGIIVPDSAKEKPQQAEVVAIGSGRLLENGERVALAVKVGNKVLIGKWSGTDVKIDGEEYLIMKEDDILGVIE
jgi:chaperonin GroES